MATDWHQAAFITPDKAFYQAKIQDHLNGICPESVLGDSHAPNEDRRFCVANQFGELLHVRTGQAGKFFQTRELKKRRLHFQLLKANRIFGNELLIDPSLLDENLQHSIKECNISAGGNGKPIICNVRSKNCASEA